MFPRGDSVHHAASAEQGLAARGRLPLRPRGQKQNTNYLIQGIFSNKASVSVLSGFIYNNYNVLVLKGGGVSLS